MTQLFKLTGTTSITSAETSGATPFTSVEIVGAGGTGATADAGGCGGGGGGEYRKSTSVTPTYPVTISVAPVDVYEPGVQAIL